MFDDLSQPVKISVYALAVIHLPKQYSENKWNENFLKTLLIQLQIPSLYYDAFLPIMSSGSSSSNSSSNDDSNSSSSNNSSSSKVARTDATINDDMSSAYLQVISTAGLDMVDLFIAITVFVTFSGYHDAHGRVFLRNLSTLTAMDRGLKMAIESEIREDLLLAARNAIGEESDVSKPAPSSSRRYLK